MPLARMMARSEAIQEHASGNPGLQTFLDKKGDEHVFSLLYLAAGIFCLYASYVHGAGFCVAPSVALQVGAASIAPPAMGRRLLDDPSNYLTGIFGGQDTHASTTGAAQLKTIPVSTAGKGPMLQEGAGGDNATETGEPAGEESVEGEVEGAVYDGKYWAGADLWVVRWLTVEGFTAVGLPFVSVVMLLLGMHENAGVSCVLYLVAIFQASPASSSPSSSASLVLTCHTILKLTFCVSFTNPSTFERKRALPPKLAAGID
ncbi:hypothetical protein T484DRAFT_2890290 [Baffinella frigidus]|nr:hypothetical protein T484DRAFT_2890290 [Cryptophyta sp. CCMP2293]